MKNGLASLHKILKDETRRKIVLLLNEKGRLSYTDLMNNLKIDNTGRLNYHLKVIDGLILKGEDGLYTLTEKGKIATQLLLKFPDENDTLQPRRAFGRKTWLLIMISYVSFSIILLLLYFYGYIDGSRFFAGVTYIFAGLAFVIAVYVLQSYRHVLDKKMLFWKIAYTMLGAWVGLVVAFFAPLLLFLFFRFLGETDLAHLQGSGEIWISLLVIGPLIGGIAGYNFGKKRGFKKRK
jgi:hypothetical protein